MLVLVLVLVQRVKGRRGAWVDAMLLQLGLEVCNLGAQIGVLGLHGLGMAAHRGASGDAVGGAAWRPVLLARGASFGAAVAADLADLEGGGAVSTAMTCMCVGRWGSETKHEAGRALRSTLQRSQAWPVRLESASFFLTEPEKSLLAAAAARC